ncbi:MAG: dienelactone hydrolase family protein [Alphaproteobacteria bacterium]|nr:dienelactone hydrolase family protein [Alphaproteobacteria bacterium]
MGDPMTEIKQDIVYLYDSFTHGVIDRRTFMERLAVLAGGTLAASAVLPLLGAHYAKAAMIAENDARVETKSVTFPGKSGAVKAYEARPKGAGKIGAVIVVHENRGTNPHIEDVTRRAAVAGFHALAVDFLSPQGGTLADADAARDAFAKIDFPLAIEDGVAAVAYLKGHAQTNGRVGAIGFCWGGGLVNQIAVHASDLVAAAPFYGPTPKPEDAAKIKAQMLLHYAGLDERINAGVPGFEAALKAAGVKYAVHMYPNVNHAFHNDTSSDRYNKEAAELAWQRSMAFFATTLRTGQGA